MFGRMLGGTSIRRGGPAAVAVALLVMLIGATGAQAQSYDAATQSHWGACSQNTLSVPHAVSDLNANKVLAQYAALVGVGANNGSLTRAMRRALVVGHVEHAVTTANHGCTTDGVIFSVGPRRLYAGETVGVRLPKQFVGHACTGSHNGCQRVVVTRAVVFPTNCWNVNFGRVRVVIWVRRPKTKPVTVTKVALPSATAILTCNTDIFLGGGTISVVMSNGAKATLGAKFTVSATGNASGGYGPTTFGPVAPGHSLTQSITVDSSGNNVSVTIVSGGKPLTHSPWVFPGGCPAAQEG